MIRGNEQERLEREMDKAEVLGGVGLDLFGRLRLPSRGSSDESLANFSMTLKGGNEMKYTNQTTLVHLFVREDLQNAPKLLKLWSSRLKTWHAQMF